MSPQAIRRCSLELWSSWTLADATPDVSCIASFTNGDPRHGYHLNNVQAAILAQLKLGQGLRVR